MDERHILTQEEIEMIENLKAKITESINILIKNGVRPANIEIELHSHIKDLLKH